MMSKMSYHHTPLGCPLDGRSWHQLLDLKAEEEPDTVAAVFYDVNLKRSTLTYAEYRDKSIHLAASLIKLGLSHGQHALLSDNSSPYYLIFMMALHRIGARALLLSPGDLTLDKVNLILTTDINFRLIVYDPDMKDSQSRQLISGIDHLVQHNTNCAREPQILVSFKDPEASRANDTDEPHTICTEDQPKNGDDDRKDGNCTSRNFGNEYEQTSRDFCMMRERYTDQGKAICYSYNELIHFGQSQDSDLVSKAEAKLGPDDKIIAIFTSGSTGTPKIVQHTTHSLLNFYAGIPGFNSSQRSILFFDRPICWMGGFIFAYMTLAANISIVYVPNEISINEPSNERVFKILEEEKISFCLISEVLINKLVQDSMHLKYDLGHVKVFMLGAQRYDFSLVHSLFELFPGVVVSMGCSSTESPKLLSQTLTKENATEDSYGKMNILPGVEVKIVDKENKIVPRGTPGEICARGCTVFLEYVGNPGETKKGKGKTGWCYTGDLGTMDDQGKVQVLGRMSRMFKRLTTTIHPDAIEKVIRKHPYVSNVIVVGIPDKQMHEEICACVILRQDLEETTLDEATKLKELEKCCEEQWPPLADGLSLKPKYYVLMKKFPVTASLKPSFQEVRKEAIKQIGCQQRQ